MPQMAPYNWLILLMMFTFIMVYLITMIYYLNNNFLSKKNKLMFLYKYKWMW